MGAVGLYSRALGTINIFSKAFTEGLWGVILPHFSKQHRDGKIDSDQYLFLVACITAVAWPFFATLGILAEPLIRILFGEKWLESVPVLRILCIHAILVYTTLLVDQMLISSGRIRTSFRIMASFQVVTVIAVLVAARYGLVWVAAAVATVGVVQLCTYQSVGQRLLQIPLASFTPIYRKNFLLVIVTVTPLLATVLTWGNARARFHSKLYCTGFGYRIDVDGSGLGAKNAATRRTCAGAEACKEHAPRARDPEDNSMMATRISSSWTTGNSLYSQSPG